MDGGTIRKTDLDPLRKPWGHSGEQRHWKAGSWYASSAACKVCVTLQQHKSVNIWQDKRHTAMEAFVLKCRKVALLRAETELHKRLLLMTQKWLGLECPLWHVTHWKLDIMVLKLKAQCSVSHCLHWWWTLEGLQRSTGHIWSWRWTQNAIELRRLRADAGILTACFRQHTQCVYNNKPVSTHKPTPSLVLFLLLSWHSPNIRVMQLTVVSNQHNHHR